MQRLSRKLFPITKKPIKIVQFGEGNFLRCFVDNFIQLLNDEKLINSGVCVIQPQSAGRCKDLLEQDGLYTLLLEGIEDSKLVKQEKLIDVISDCINPYTEFDKFSRLAENPDLEIIISNTTEAGIAYTEETPNIHEITSIPESFPGKLLYFLYKRYKAFKETPLLYAKTLEIVPCELIDYNGTKLSQVLNKLAKYYNMSSRFIDWLNKNRFYNTLVDRIVPGYPKDEIDTLTKKLGYIDTSIVKGEIFHLWVIEGPHDLKEKLPFEKTNIHAYYVDDITPYKQQKVKILNGSHTALVPISYLMGHRTVKESMDDNLVSTFVNKFINHDVKNTINLDKDKVDSFSKSVLERFSNPYIRHLLYSIMLNSVSKYKARILPSYLESKKNGIVPIYSMFALAGLFVLYYRATDDKGESVVLNDENVFLELFNTLRAKKDINRALNTFLSLEYWDTTELSSDAELINKYVSEILLKGSAKALKDLL